MKRDVDLYLQDILKCIQSIETFTKDFYFGIDYEIVWNVVKKKLPLLKKEIKKLLNQYKKNKAQSA